MKWDIFYVNNRSWLESIEWCPVYLATDALTCTAIIFFITTLNLHTVSTYNLACKTIAKNRSRSLAQQKLNDAMYNDGDSEFDDGDSEFDDIDDDEDDDHICNKVVVTSNTKLPEVTIKPDYTLSRQRSIVIDYSKSKSHISVLWPIVFVWLLAISISIPLYFYGRIIPSQSRDSNDRMCGLVQIDRSNNYLLQILLIKIRIVVPTLCLALSTIYVFYKLAMAKRETLESFTIEIMTCIDEDAIQILKLALALALTFIVCSLQRIYGSLWFELISRPMMEYKYSQWHKWFGVAGCLLHYIAIIVRPFIYWRYELKLRRDLKTICCCIQSFCGRRKF